MTTLRITVLSLASLAATAPRAAAADLSHDQRIELLLEAQHAFDRGIESRRSNPAAATDEFREAASKFQALADSGLENGRLYYNLANAELEAGRTGRAILNYRRAEKLLPGDGRIEANLRFAHSLRRNEIAPSGERALLRTLFFWHFTTSLRTRYDVAIASFVLFWLLLILRNARPARAWMYALIPCLLLAVSIGASVAIECNDRTAHREGVILADEVVARKGDSEGFEPSFQQKLYQGVEFIQLERRGDWLHIELPDGKTGWIRAEQAELI